MILSALKKDLNSMKNFIEADIQYHEKLCKLHNDLPFCLKE